MRGSRFAIAYELSPMGRTVSSRAAIGVVGFGLALALVGCGGGSSGTSRASTTPTTADRATAPATISLTSPVLAQGRPVPSRFTCDGLDDPPPLRWSGVPAGTAELALLLEDENAQGESGAPFVHWSLFGIPPSATRVPSGARQGTNDFHQLTYGGPCPPDNDPAHRYVFTLYALRAALDLPDGAPPTDLRAAIARAASAQGRLTVTYTRGGG
jgi:Raf kinase inhibitor-like YbhB/YbcL family protein